MLEQLRDGHPRLTCTDDDLERVRGFIESDDTARKYWGDVRGAAEAILDEPTCTYNIVGPRLLHESRNCLRRVSHLALTYRLTGEERFADRAIEEMLAAAGFPDWNPSHFLDTAEMTHALAIGYDWLFDYLSDEQRTAIREAIVRHGLQPGRDVYANKQHGGFWVMTHNNWNQVCNGGMTIGALAIGDEEPELCEYILQEACESLPRAMATYAPDGGCEEGPGYWHYAASYTAYMLAALESALGSDQGLSEFEGFDVTGFFRIHSCGPLGLTFSYADATDHLEQAKEMFWLARRFDQPVFAWHEKQIVRQADPWHLIWYDPRGVSPTEAEIPPSAAFRGIDVAFLRSGWEDPNAIYVGLKGGDNRASHSHLDLGSFVLDAVGVRWGHDLGKDYYNLPGYFGRERWTYYRLRTESHNAILINDENQLTDAKAPLTEFKLTGSLTSAVVDMSQTYEALSNARRGVALIDAKAVLIQDDIDADRTVDVLWGMITYADVECEGDRAELRQDGKVLHADIISPAGAIFDTVSANPEPPEDRNEGARKLVVRLPEKTHHARIAVVFWLGDEAALPPELTSLDRWR